jgi:hypothetical protein
MGSSPLLPWEPLSAHLSFGLFGQAREAWKWKGHCPALRTAGAMVTCADSSFPGEWLAVSVPCGASGSCLPMGRMFLVAVLIPENGLFCFIRTDSCCGLPFLAIPRVARGRSALVQHRAKQEFQLGRILYDCEVGERLLFTPGNHWLQWRGRLLCLLPTLQMLYHAQL